MGDRTGPRYRIQGTRKRKEDRDEDGGQEKEEERDKNNLFLFEISPHPCKRGGDLYVRLLYIQK